MGKRSPKQALILILLQLVMFGIIAWIFATVCRMCSVTHNGRFTGTEEFKAVGLGYGFLFDILVNLFMVGHAIWRSRR